MFRYLMIALFCFVVAKTTVRIVHYANPTAFSQPAFPDVRDRLTSARSRQFRQTFSSFCRQRTALTSSGIGVSGKLVFQLVTPTSPT